MKLRRHILVIFGFIESFFLLGCSDSEYMRHRDFNTEIAINEFYLSNQEQFEINRISNNLPIDAYCVLTPYENNLSDYDDEIVLINKFLKQIDLKGEEDYWHIVVKSADRFILIRINARTIPLASEYSILKERCFFGKILLIKKLNIFNDKKSTLKIGY